jgi:hypothetical protein
MSAAKKYKELIIFFIFFTLVFFQTIFDSSNFKLFHDQFYKYDIINKNGNLNLIFQSDFLDQPSGIKFFVTIFDRLYYFLAYKLTDKTSIILQVENFTKIASLILISYLSFQKISKLQGNQIKNIKLLLISIFYTFSPFSILYWHGNNFSISLYLVYLLAPILILNLEIIFSNNSYEPSKLNYINLSLIIFLTLPGFYLSIPLYFFCFIYILQFYSNYKRKFTFFKKILKIFVINIPAIFIIFPIIAEYLISSENLERSINSENTYSNIKYGVFGIISGIASWGNFHDWGEYPLFLFSKIYTSYFSIALFLILFVSSFFIIDLNKKKNRFLGLILILIIILAKANHLPFGYLFDQLIKIDIFLFLRSPDNKLSFLYFLFLSLILIQSKKLNKKIYFINYISLTSAVVISLICFFFFTFPKANMKLNNNNFINSEFYNSLLFLNEENYVNLGFIPKNRQVAKYDISKDKSLFFRNPYIAFTSFTASNFKNIDQIEQNKISHIIWFKYSSINFKEAFDLKKIINNFDVVYENSTVKIFKVNLNEKDYYLKLKNKNFFFKELNDYYYLGNFKDHKEIINMKFIGSSWFYLFYDKPLRFWDFKIKRFSKKIVLDNNVIIFNIFAFLFKLFFFITFLYIMILYLKFFYSKKN